MSLFAHYYFDESMLYENTAYGRQRHDDAVTGVRQIHYIRGAIHAAKAMPILARRGPEKSQRPMTMRSPYLSYCASDKLLAKYLGQK